MNFDELAERERQAFTRFKESYEVRNPPPAHVSIPKPERTGMKSAGFLFWFEVVWGIAAVLLTALRTADAFIRAASNSGVFFSRAEGFLAVIAMDTGLIILAAAKAKRSLKPQNEVIENLAIGAIFLITLVAGLDQGFHISDRFANISNGLQFVLAIMLGAASFVSLIAGEIIGRGMAEADVRYKEELARWEARQNELDEGYRRELHEYEERLTDDWERSEERAIVREDVRVAAIEARAAVKGAKSRSLPVQLNKLNNKLNRNEQRISPKTQKVFDYLNEVFYETNEVPGPREIERETGVSVGTASQARVAWLEQMGIEE